MIFKNYKFLVSILLLLLMCKPKNTEETLQGEAFLSDAISRDPENDSLYYARAKIYIADSLFDLAIADLNKAIAFDSLQPEYFHSLTDALLMNIESREALKVMDRAIQYFPEDINTILKSAQLQLTLKKHMSALATLDKVFIRDPQNANAMLLAGHIFYEMGDTGRAVNSYQKAVDMDPQLREGWMKLGDILIEMKNPKALAYYNNAFQMDSSMPEIYHNKAYALDLFGKKTEAIQLYKQLIIRFPDYEPAYYNIAIIYKDIDSISQALNYFDKAIQLKPEEASNYYHKALCYLKIKDKTKAKEYLLKAIQLFPDYIDAQKELKKL